MNLDKVIAERSTKTIYHDGDRSIKVFNTGYSKADVLNEALNQARIEEIGLNVPKVLEVTSIDGRWAIVSEFIEGVTLAELMEKYPEKKREYVELLVDLQMSIHARFCPLLNRMKDKMSRMIAQTELDATTRYSLHTRLNEDTPKHSKVCHGDFTPSNIIITDDGTPFVIDWSHVTQGNASADASHSYLKFWMNGDISGSEIYLDTFCAKSGTAKQYVRKWMPLVAASQLIKCNDKKREFLMSWIDFSDHQ